MKFLILLFLSISASASLVNVYNSSAPITKTNNTFGIPQSNTSTDGYLSATDWNTFNNKGSPNSTVTTTVEGNNYNYYGAVFSQGSDVAQGADVVLGLTFNPSNDVLTTTTFSGALTGTASGNTKYTANNHGVVISGSANTMTVIAPDSSTTKVLTSGGSSADPTWSAVPASDDVLLTHANGWTHSKVHFGPKASGCSATTMPTTGCSSDPCDICQQTPAFVTAVNWSNTGIYVVHFTNPYTTAPLCSLHLTNFAGSLTLIPMCLLSAASTSTVTFTCTGSSGAADNVSGIVECDGAK